MFVFCKNKNHNKCYYAYYFAKCVMIFSILISGCVACSSKQVYVDADLSINLELPRNWVLEKDERISLLDLRPKDIDPGEMQVSIRILGIADEGQELSVALEDEIKRLRRTTALDEVKFIRPPEEFANNSYEEALIATIAMPLQFDSKANSENHELTQPMDLIVIRGSEKLIILYVYKSNTNEEINIQADDIVNSIRLMK